MENLSTQYAGIDWLSAVPLAEVTYCCLLLPVSLTHVLMGEGGGQLISRSSTIGVGERNPSPTLVVMEKHIVGNSKGTAISFQLFALFRNVCR